MKAEGLAITSRTRNRGLGLALIPLSLSYIVVGWSLSAHHILWFVGVLLALLGVVSAWVSGSHVAKILEGVPKFFVAVFLVLAASLLLTFAFTHALFPTLVVIPLGTTWFAWQELRSLHIQRYQTILTLAALALASLGVGECIDIWWLPSY
ncbi:hypothetical protein GS597_05090 [Synechococcales cyanobacterium C]|uniref:Uncharacterized protein n=1 Tax=Petrachloros mirabilis ULC683 TaxID=2781853 RepID=A0A8K1ZXI4_9CYAN|nr:hypothetical protein [Petrachloros mirabilis]NCJ05896.1 hypothetical protein [Petrachloros mirabilis ULC683]